ncbi:MAG: adenine phosphoribosyltransferase [Candidatus Omnitrophica bacterium]|nr:adenine phosphoribosyltransferase [Candidatus Omnitrophota bacterium]
MNAKTKIASSDDLKNLIRDVPDFPKKGIIFKDITPILKDPDALRYAVNELSILLEEFQPDQIVGIESRGFIFSPILAYKLRAGFIPVRKKGKLPAETIRTSYQLEYGESELEIHQDAILKGMKVAVVDDLLATGGTSKAAIHLVEKLGGQVAAVAFLVELTFLKGREKLRGYNIFSLVQY